MRETQFVSRTRASVMRIPLSGMSPVPGPYKKAHPLVVDPPSDMSMSCTRRAESESGLYLRLPRDFSVFVALCTPPPTDQKSFITFSTSNTTTAHTQMDLRFVAVQGHQKALENTETLMKIDVFVCLVVQESGVYRGGSAPPDPPFLSRPGRTDPGISRTPPPPRRTS